MEKDAPTEAATFLLWWRIIAIMHVFVFRLVHWPDHRKTVLSSVLVASQTGSMDFEADALE